MVGDDRPLVDERRQVQADLARTANGQTGAKHDGFSTGRAVDPVLDIVGHPEIARAVEGVDHER